MKSILKTKLGGLILAGSMLFANTVSAGTCFPTNVCINGVCLPAVVCCDFEECHIFFIQK